MRKNLKELFDMNGRVIVLTGAGGLLGPEYADILSEAGANLVLVYYKEKERTDEMVEQIKSAYGTNPINIYCDISNKDDVKRMTDKVIETYGKIDVLINNAVYNHADFPQDLCGTLEDYPEEAWRKAIDVNITGVFLCCQIIGNQMIKQGHGNIINISSIYGIIGSDQRIYEGAGFNTPLSYGTAKGAILNLTRYLASYWRGKNIRVNTLSPGGVYRDKFKGTKFKEEYEKRTIVGRMANSWDYRGAMLFLASDASEYMTGANLIIDGGWTAV